MTGLKRSQGLRNRCARPWSGVTDMHGLQRANKRIFRRFFGDSKAYSTRKGAFRRYVSDFQNHQNRPGIREMVLTFWWFLHQNRCISHRPPVYCISRLNKGLDDRRIDPNFGGAAIRIMASSQIAQKRDLRAVWVSESLLAAVWASESIAVVLISPYRSDRPELKLGLPSLNTPRFKRRHSH